MAAWEENVRKVVPYTPGEQPNRSDIIKLNTNENPYPPAPGVAEILREMDVQGLRKYPDPTADDLVSALAEYHGLQKEQVFVGVGSDDVLAMSFLTFFNSQKPVLFPDITYSFYDVWAELFRIPYQCQPLDEKFQIRTEDYLKDCGGIVIANPNAPTGTWKELAELEQIIAGNPEVIVIIDEAYIDFGGESARSLIDKYENLLVVQTFSKSRAMAGMRIGYAMGSKTLIKALQDVKYSYNSYTMNMPSIILGAEAVKDDGYFKDIVGRIVKVRETAKKKFAELGFSGTDSQTNFLFITHEKVPAAEIFEALKRKQIYVRYFSAPRLDNYLRVTIGTEEDMEVMYEFLNDYLKVAVL